MPTEKSYLALKQKWIVILPTGERYSAGSSYHLAEHDRVQMIGEVTARLSTDIAAEREEPTGEPWQVSLSESFYNKIVSARGSLRVK